MWLWTWGSAVCCLFVLLSALCSRLSMSSSPNYSASSVRPSGATHTRSRGGIDVFRPSFQSQSFASKQPRIRKQVLPAGAHCPIQYCKEQHKAVHRPTGGKLPQATRDTSAAFVSRGRPNTAPVSYIAAAPTDISARLRTTERRYASCMRETGKDPARFPMSQVRPQYSRCGSGWRPLHAPSPPPPPPR